MDKVKKKRKSAKNIIGGKIKRSEALRALHLRSQSWFPFGRRFNAKKFDVFFLFEKLKHDQRVDMHISL